MADDKDTTRASERKAYAAAWYAKNKEKKIAQAKRFREANREVVRARSRKRYAADPERHCGYVKKHREKHKDAKTAREREKYWADPEKYRAKSLRYLKENPEKHAAVERARRARSRGAEGTHTAAEAQEIRKRQNGQCAYCGVKLGRKAHLDHIEPLARGGSNWPRNLQWLCAPCNQSKTDMDPIAFAQRRGLLL